MAEAMPGYEDFKLIQNSRARARFDSAQGRLHSFSAQLDFVPTFR